MLYSNADALQEIKQKSISGNLEQQYEEAGLQVEVYITRLSENERTKKDINIRNRISEIIQKAVSSE